MYEIHHPFSYDISTDPAFKLMAGSSYLPPDALQYLYASTANVSNFVSVKLSGSDNYHLWQAQILCLMKSHNMCGLVDDTFSCPSASSPGIKTQYDNLLKGWIFGSISERLLGIVVDIDTAKEVWEKLKYFYDPTMLSHAVADSSQTKLVAETETTDNDGLSIKAKTRDVDVVSAQTETETETETETKIKVEDAISIETMVKDVISTEMITRNVEAVSTETKTEVEDEDVVSKETQAKDEVAVSTQANTEDLDVSAEKETGDKEVVQVETKAKGAKSKGKDKITRNKELCKAIVEERWGRALSILSEDEDAITEAINSDGNTVLHIAVGIGINYFVGEVLSLIKDSNRLPKLINLHGSTALHIAAVVGNTHAAELLIRKNKSLLEISDRKGETPLHKAYENMHLETIEYLLMAAIGDGDTKKKSIEDSLSPSVEIGVSLLVNAISGKQYDFATKLVIKFPAFAVENDSVLMSIARTFPSGLEYGETLFYPSFDDISKRIVKRTKELFENLVDFYEVIEDIISDLMDCTDMIGAITILGLIMLFAPIFMIFLLIRLLLLIVYYPIFMVYFLSWKVAARVVAPIKHIEKKKKEWEEAKKVLKLVCDEIDKLDRPADETHPRYYTKPVLEAARQNHFEVVDEILLRSPEAIRYKDKNGYDIVQLAVIHRSEKIYNLIYMIGERKSVYRTIEDSSKNNMLHLAGRLAPSHKLKHRTGAALQLQRELQWREEVEKLVFPAYITKENIFMETPDMVFTKEHENLVKEGEKWMKTVAESCSITAALITTIVFAAAITVPGGSHQETGIPLFTEEAAFTIFAVSDAISLFTSSTALLMFLSILTARFAEQDFLVSLPRRLIIALCTLLVSTTAMMVAFGATMFLVFGRRKPWMLVPICVSAFLPIASFGILQIPLIVDLFRSTYGRIFGKQSHNNNTGFNPNAIRLFFGK